MKAKNKAQELVERFTLHQSDDYPNSDEDYHAKQCALICVDEILESLWNVGHSFSNDEIKYWKEVKQEIKKQ